MRKTARKFAAPEVAAAAKAAVLVAFRQGMTTINYKACGIEGEAELPGFKTVQRWRASDPEFAAAFKVAQLEGGTVSSPQHGAESKKQFLDYIRAGGARSRWDAERPDGAAYNSSVNRWLKDPHFRREYESALKERGTGHKRLAWWKAGERQYYRVFCDLVEDVRKGGSPTRFIEQLGRSKNSLNAFMDKRPNLQLAYRQMFVLRMEGPPSVAELRFIRDRLTRAVDKAKAADERELVKQIDRLSIEAAKKQQAAERAIAKASREHEKTSAERPKQIGVKLRAGLLREDVYRAAEAAVPKHLDPDDRADIITDVVMQLLERSVSSTEILAIAKALTSKHMQAYKSKKSISLDAELYDDGDATLLDTLTTDEFNYAD